MKENAGEQENEQHVHARHWHQLLIISFFPVYEIAWEQTNSKHTHTHIHSNACEIT